MKVRPMIREDRETVLPMADALYHTDAADHAVPARIMEKVFDDATGENPHIEGYIIEEDGQTAGFAYLTFFYACELAGMTVMLEELFMKDEFRSRGLGDAFLTWLCDRYSDASRFRLELNMGNPAEHLYLRKGFRFIDYGQMVYDR